MELKSISPQRLFPIPV